MPGRAVAAVGVGFVVVTLAVACLGAARESTRLRSDDVGVSPNATTAYLGCGCFWHVQHEVVSFEEEWLGRQGLGLTARTGYAGGTSTGPLGLVCYHNYGGLADYGRMGHGEVVSLDLQGVDDKKVEALARIFFGSICVRGVRRDIQDVGAEYRSLVGLPGGLDSPAGRIFQRVAAESHVTLVEGKGGDEDAHGTVYVMDPERFPFYRAEVYHQFHDDMIESYPAFYHDLREEFVSAGALPYTGCPRDTGRAPIRR